MNLTGIITKLISVKKLKLKRNNLHEMKHTNESLNDATIACRFGEKNQHNTHRYEYIVLILRAYSNHDINSKVRE